MIQYYGSPLVQFISSRISPTWATAVRVCFLWFSSITVSMPGDIRHIYKYETCNCVVLTSLSYVILESWRLLWGVVVSSYFSFLCLNMAFQLYYGLIVETWYWSMWWFRKRASFEWDLQIASAQETPKPTWSFISFLWPFSLEVDRRIPQVAIKSHSFLFLLLYFFRETVCMHECGMRGKGGEGERGREILSSRFQTWGLISWP